MSENYGKYRQMLLEQQSSHTLISSSKEDSDLQKIPFRIRFYVSLILFVCYLLLDYSNGTVYNLSSQSICDVIAEDYVTDSKLFSFFHDISTLYGDVSLQTADQ